MTTAAAAGRRAELLASPLPPLLVAAERVAATVAQGVHGRRRVGQGESFWQFRPFSPGDSLHRIDWRQSAKSDREFVRETEWEAAQTVCLWRDGGESMRWRSQQASVDKRARAELLLLALAALLLRGGERVRFISRFDRSRFSSGRAALEALASQLSRPDADDDAGTGLPPQMSLPRHAHVMLFGDFLSPIEGVAATIARLAAVPLSGHLVQILDPAEAVLPYSGRIQFHGIGGAGRAAIQTLIPRVEGVREEYARRLAAQQHSLAGLCAAAGFGFTIHRTDQPPETALLALYAALASR